MQIISLSQITPNPDQPRKHFDAGKLHELASSIRARGLMQPITVRPKGGKPMRYEIVAGERRFRAHLLLQEQGHTKDIACLVQKMTNSERDLQAILENLARADIKPIEEAMAFKRMIDAGWTEAQLAKDLGISQAFRIRDRIKLLSCNDAMQKLVDTNQFPASVAYYAADLPDHEQTAVLRAFNSGKTTSQLRAMIQAFIDRTNQKGMFGDEKPDENSNRCMKSMEDRINEVAAKLATGWKNGECQVAKKVDPNRAGKLADKLVELGKMLKTMERDLRQAEAMAELV